MFRSRPLMAGNQNDRLQGGNLIERPHPVFPSLVLGNSEVNPIEHSIARHHGFEGWNVDEAVSGTIALHPARNRELLAFEREHGNRKFLGENGVGPRNIVAVGWEPELLPCWPAGLGGVDRGRKRHYLSGGECLMQHSEPEEMIRVRMRDVDQRQVLL